MSTTRKEIKKSKSFRFNERTRLALRAKAKSLGTSQANAIGVVLGVFPESAFARGDKVGNLVIR